MKKLEEEIAKTLDELHGKHEFIAKVTDNEVHITHDMSDTRDEQKNWIHITKVSGPKIDVVQMIRSAVERA